MYDSFGSVLYRTTLEEVRPGDRPLASLLLSGGHHWFIYLFVANSFKFQRGSPWMFADGNFWLKILF